MISTSTTTRDLGNLHIAIPESPLLPRFADWLRHFTVIDERIYRFYGFVVAQIPLIASWAPSKRQDRKEAEGTHSESYT
jgi:hypothetical protein